jgi:hypothetical protein
MAEFFEILWGFERMCFFMSFWLGKKSATNLKYQRLWRSIGKKAVGFGGVGGRGGVPGRRKRRGYVAGVRRFCRRAFS